MTWVKEHMPHSDDEVCVGKVPRIETKKVLDIVSS